MQATAEPSIAAPVQTAAAAAAPTLTVAELFQQARVEEERRIQAARREQERQAAEASLARQAQIAILKGEMDQLRVLWEQHRRELRATFAQLFAREQALLVVSQGAVSYLAPHVRLTHLPSAFPSPSEALHPVFSSAESDVQSWLASGRRTWPHESEPTPGEMKALLKAQTGTPAPTDPRADGIAIGELGGVYVSAGV